MESNGTTTTPSIGKKLMDIVRVVYYMLRKGISKRKLMMDLHLLLKRGKLAGKALRHLMTFGGDAHHHGTSSAYHHTSSFSCRSVDPNVSYYNPREVEFSCSNTPYIPRRRHGHHRRSYEYEAVAAIARAFEMLNNHEAASDAESVMPSPSPALMPKSTPKGVRQLRITDSPFPIKEGEVADPEVDKEAEEFINRFYEQLKSQQSLAAMATPEYYKFRRGRY